MAGLTKALGGTSGQRLACVALAIVFVLIAQARVLAEWQLKPFIGTAFAGDTTFIDFDQASGKPHVAYGLDAVLLGDVLGVESDLGYSPGFFQTGSSDLVLHSGVMTLTGNAVIAMPRRLVQYALRPYLVGGAGLMRVQIEHAFDVLAVSSNLLAIDLGAGATGFLTRRIGLSWEIRHFASRSKSASSSGFSIGPEDLSFWRASMTLAIRLDPRSIQ